MATFTIRKIVVFQRKMEAETKEDALVLLKYRYIGPYDGWEEVDSCVRLIGEGAILYEKQEDIDE